MTRASKLFRAARVRPARPAPRRLAICPLEDRTAPAIAYGVPAGTIGNQAFGGSLGMDFDVNQTITITRVGVFDSGSDGLAVPITAHIYNRDTGTDVIAPIAFAAGNTGTLIGGSRFLDLATPLTLPAGFHGTIVAEGYGASEPNGNSGGAAPPWTTDSFGGAISFVGGGRFGFTPGAFPTNLDGGPANRYAAGSFDFTPTDLVFTGTGADDTFVVDATSANSGTMTINGGTPIPFAGINSLTVNGLAGNDVLRVNNPAGALFAPASGIHFDGGTQTSTPGDRLEVLGGAHTTENHTFFPTSPNGNVGAVALVNGASTATYSYTGLEPVLINAGTPTDVVFNLPTGDGNNNATLGDNGLADGLSQIAGTGFETTTFANPSNSLTVNTGNDGETTTLAAFEAGFATPTINLIGGTGGDTFAVTPPAAAATNIDGGGGVDVVIGTAGNDTFTMTAPGAGNFGGTVAFVNIENLDGAGGANSLVGDNGGRTFTITGANSGTVGGLLSGGFANVQNLTGGTGTDSFIFNGGSLAGNIDGGGGVNAFTGDAGGRTFTINAANGGTVGTLLGGSFANIQNLTGGSGSDSFVFTTGTLSGGIDGGGGSDILTGDNSGRLFNINTPDGGTVGGLLALFFNVENLTGGSGPDLFTFTAPGTLSGSIDGGGGTNTLTGDATGRTFTINAANGGTVGTLLGGSFSNIQNLTGGGAADSFVFTTGTLSGVIDGGAGSDTITGDNTGRLFNVTGSNTGIVTGILGSPFVNVENLAGGSASDTFVFTSPGALTGTIDGGAGIDTLTGDNVARAFSITGANAGNVSTILPVGFTNVEVLNGGTANDTFTFGPGGLIGQIDGGAGTDTITGDNTARTFTITGGNIGTISTIVSNVFLNVENLTGGTGADAFVFTTGTLSGTIDGGAGSDTLTGDNTGRTFSVTGANSGTLLGLTAGGFSNVENLTGGTGNDQFTFATPGSLTGSVNGGAGTNSLTGDNAGRAFTINAPNGGIVGGLLGGAFINIQNLTGGTGADSFTFTTGALAGNIDGAGGIDTLTGDNTGRTFTVNAANGGTVVGLLGGSFSNVENLTGGTGADSFVFTTGTLSGNVDGGAGTDTLTGDNTGRTYTVIGPNTGGISGGLIGGFSNVENLTGGTSGDSFVFVTGTLAGNVDGGGGINSLTGDGGGRAFTINATNGGTVGGLLGGTFANIQNLTGGAGADSFLFVSPGTLTGSIDAGGGTDTLTGDGGGRTFIVNAANGGTVGGLLGGTFSAVENLAGGTGADAFVFTTGTLSGNVDGAGGTDTLAGDNTARTFTVTAANGGTVGGLLGGSFSNVESLTGGSAGDAFTFATGGSLGGTVTGGGGTDTITGDNAGDAFSVSGADAGSIATLLPAGFTGVENLVGGTGADSFTFVTPGSLSGTIDGGAGTDTLVGDNVGRTFTITGPNAGTVTVILPARFSNIENLTGGTGNDTFVFAGGTLSGTINGGGPPGVDNIVGDDTGRTYTINGANSGTISGLGAFAGIANLTAGAGADSFVFVSPGTLSGSINAGGGTDTLTADGGGRTFTINAADGGALSTILGGTFSAVENLAGGGGADAFVFTTGTLSGNVDGGAGADTLAGDNTARTFTVTAANSGTVTTILGGSFSNVESLTGGSAGDAFTFAAGGSLTGTINGGGGTDTITGDNTGRTFNITGANAGNIAAILPAPGGFVGVENLVGGTGNDQFTFATGGSLAGTIDGGAGTNSLTGDNAARTFTINAANAGTVGTILTAGFTNIQNLSGGSAADGFTFVGPAGALTGTINGGGGSDTITGDDTGRTFTITAANAGNVGTILAAGFTSVENLAGGSANDQFTFAGGSLTGTINGGGGTNTITGDNGTRTYTITGANAGTIGTLLPNGFTNVENLVGGTGNDQFTFNNGGSLSGTINGGAGVGIDTITGDNNARTFTITSPNAGTISGILTAGFLDIENLTGGTQNDAFTFQNGGTLSGNINAGNGSDVLTADDGGRTFTLTGTNAGTLSTILGGTFSLINALVGGAGNDTFVFNNGGSLTTPGNIDGGAGNDKIVGDDAGRTFTVTAANAGTVNTILAGSFTNVENLTGGAGADQFTFNNGGSLSGNIDGAAGTDTLTGDNAARTFTVTAANSGNVSTILTAGFSNVENLVGGTANDRFQFVTPGGLGGTIDGGTGTDTLAGDNAARTFTLTGADAGTVSIILPAGFVNVENLEGGTAGDNLVVQAAGSLAGSFDGKAGTDGVDLSAVLTAQSLTVTGLGGIDGFNVGGSPAAGGLLNINALTASAAFGDTLTGLNADTEWRLTGVNAGTYKDVATAKTLPISGFENLNGGGARDAFVFDNGGVLTGTAAGNAGVDTVDGDDGGRTFDVTGAGAGNVTVILPAGFTGIENLIGGSGTDRLLMEAAGTLAGSFDGLGGTDTADLSALVSQQITVTAEGGTDGFNTTGGTSVAGGLFNLDSLIESLAGTTDSLTGLNVASTWTVATPNGGTYQDASRTLAFANDENLTGGSDTDLLVVQAAGFLGGAFDGKGGTDTADLSATAGQTPTIATAGATDGYDLSGVTGVGGGLLNLQKVIGSTTGTSDKLTGRNVAATWTVDAANGGHYQDVSTGTLDFVSFENLTGGTDNDRLAMQAGGSLTGAFDGGLGIDTGDFSAVGAQQFVVAATGAADGFNVGNVPTVPGNLLNLDAVVGSTAGTTDRLTGMSTQSTFTVTAANGGNYLDNASTRTLAFTQVENLNGGTADDLLVVKLGGSLAGSFDGGAGRDTADLSALTAVQQIGIQALGGADGFNTSGGTTVAGGFQNLDKVVGGHAASAVLGGGDRLTNRDADGTFLVKAGADASLFTDVGSGRTLVFAGFEELFGGSAKDGFTVDFSAGVPVGAIGLTVNGQGGFDTLTGVGSAAHDGFALGTKVFRMNLKPIRYSNMENLTADGGGGNDVFNAPNATMPASVQVVQFFGRDGNDVAVVAPTLAALVHLDGGAGTDTLKLVRGLARFLAPIPTKSQTSGTYSFSNRKALEFISFEIRDIGITQPQP
jgi:hypothetical protein